MKMRERDEVKDRSSDARRESVTIGSGYFWFYAGIGAFTPYAALYYQHLGFSGTQLGLLTALPALAVALTGPFWGALADSLGAHRAILRSMTLVAMIVTLLLSQVTGFGPFLVTLGIVAFAVVPVPALWDSYAVSASERGGASFGVLRIFGSLGFTAMVLVAGALMAGGMSNRFLFAYAGAHLLTFLSTLMLPKLSERKSRRLFGGLGELRTRRPFLLLLLVAYLIACGLAMVNNFLGIHIRELGSGTDIVGVAFAVASLTELPVIGFGMWIMKRVSARRMVVIALVAYIVRFLLLALAPSAEWVIAAQLLHGVTFGMFLVASVHLAHRMAGQENAATAQALLMTVSFGFGNITGALSGGVLIDAVGTRWVYTGVVGLMVIALTVYVVGMARLGTDAYETGNGQPASG